MFLLRRCPLVAVTATAAPDAGAGAGAGDAAATCDAGVCSMCLNVNSVSRTDVCDNQDPTRIYSLQPEASAS